MRIYINGNDNYIQERKKVRDYSNYYQDNENCKRILNIADEIVLLNNGKIKKMGKKEEIIGDILKQETTGFCAKLGGEGNE